MDDAELNKLLNAFLSSDVLSPSLARTLTQAARQRNELDTPLKRKLFKVYHLAKHYRIVFDEIASRLNKQFGSTKNPMGYSTSNYFDTVHHIFGVRLPGCFESPYESHQVNDNPD